MSFGTEHGQILEEKNCPRCNAVAKVRARVRGDSNVAMKILTCDKCRLIDFQGLTTQQFLNDIPLIRKLERYKERAVTAGEKIKIEKRIEKIKERSELSDIGL
jgi:transcription elongation factor Elf1